MYAAARRSLQVVTLGALCYQIAAVLYPVHGALVFYYFHLGLVLVLVLVVLNIALDWARKDGGMLHVAALAACALLMLGSTVSTGYLHLTVSEIELRQPFITDLDFAADTVMILCVVVLTYFVWGAILAGLIVLAILYFSFGDLVPGAFTCQPQIPDIIMSYLAGIGGARGVIWSIPLLANTLFLIIVCDGLLKGTRISSASPGTWAGTTGYRSDARPPAGGRRRG